MNLLRVSHQQVKHDELLMHDGLRMQTDTIAVQSRIASDTGL